MKFTIKYLENSVTYRKCCKFQVIFATVWRVLRFFTNPHSEFENFIVSS
jgi:hypothetical protein